MTADLFSNLNDAFNVYNPAAGTGYGTTNTVTLSTTARVGKSASFDGASYLRVSSIPDSFWQGTYTLVCYHMHLHYH
jgi:hypothetical protein